MKHFSSLLLSTALLLLALGGLVGCGDSGTSQEAAKITVTGFQFSRLEGGTRVFTGKVHNPTGRAVPGVQISVSLLDADNRQVSSTLIEVRDIAAHDSTAFRQPFDSDQEASSARVRSLTVM